MRKARNGEPMKWVHEMSSYDGDDCLIWPFARSPNGYGMLLAEGKFITASRYMCVVAHGKPVSPKLQATHSCGNGHIGCMTPKHLRWRTAQQNAAEKVDHGTHHRGARNATCKLTEVQVLRLRSCQPGERLSDLAREFGVSLGAACDARARRTWAWL